MTLTLKYDASLPYQTDAIAAVVDLFAGQPLAGGSRALSFTDGPLQLTEFGLGNQLVVPKDRLFTNLQAVQERNGIERSTLLGAPDFTVEMETGTGKTYVYLRTAFELNKTYGLRKFVIVVPSVPIREGVLHSLSTMRAHFQALYGVPFDYTVYDSKRLGALRAFATANTLQFLIINIQAFQRDVRDGDDGAGVTTANVIYRENDRLSGHRPIDFLRATRPITIIDEPQKMTGDASTAAINRLDPLCTLRYSATYEGHNKVYRLGPIEALDQKLVKRIEVASVREDANLNDAYIRLLNVDGKKRSAQIELNVGSGATVNQRKITVKPGDDLFARSDGRQEYRNGFRVGEISFETDNAYLTFGNGVLIRLGDATGGLDDEVMRAQVYETVREHLDKEARLRSQGIKVLSLFFIDRVENYRRYHPDGKSYELGKIGHWFEDAYAELTRDARYAKLITDPVERIHNGYFSVDRKGAYRDTSGQTKDDESAYELIMRDKERLLSLDNPLRFIFSHSALREGWDNPNVFQICTLNESRSATRKRQEIGRGLRLPVNQAGERIRDERINRLTVIANESYRDFAAALQTEYEEDANLTFGVVPAIAFSQLSREPGPAGAGIGQAESKRIWDDLVTAGYLDTDGRVLDRFNPKDANFQLQVSSEFADLAAQITDTVSAYLFSDRVVNARRRQPVTFRKQLLLDPGFQALWTRISPRTRYRVMFDSDELIAKAADRVRDAEPINPLRISVTTVGVDQSYAGVGIGETRRQYDREVRRDHHLPDILAYLQNETNLTRQTLAHILIRSGRAEDLRVNPQAFITMVTREITAAVRALMLSGIEYQRLDGQVWEMRRLEADAEQTLERHLDNLYQVRHPEKSLSDYVEIQSDVERKFAKALDEHEAVKYFVKLPSWFRVDTPLGDYNPDWAFMLQGGDTLYLVRETKGSTLKDDLRAQEHAKITCGKRHFAAIGVDYAVTTSLGDTLRSLRSAQLFAACGTNIG